MTDLEQLDALAAISPNAELRTDGTVTCVFMPNTTLQTSDGIKIMDVALCPRGLSGYSTRLLLERKIDSKSGLNWQVVTLINRLWHTWSWNQIAPDQPWIRIFAEHARVLR